MNKKIQNVGVKIQNVGVGGGMRVAYSWLLVHILQANCKIACFKVLFLLLLQPVSLLAFSNVSAQNSDCRELGSIVL